MNLPIDIQIDWSARLEKAEPTAIGAFHLIAARRTDPAGFEGQRITVLVLDENGIALPGVKVAFSYSTAPHYPIYGEWLWSPPIPQRAFVASTKGSGEIDQIQGSGVKQGEPGGVTVYIFEPEYSSDIVTGAGMLADHTGLHLTFQRARVGAVSYSERLAALDQWVANFDAWRKSIDEWREEIERIE